MPRIKIASNDGYELIYDLPAKTVELIEKMDRFTPVMNAKFFYDNSDGAAILSDFQSKREAKEPAKMIADLVSDFLSKNKDKCKLFCHAGTHEVEFADSKDYRTTDIDRLMLREEDKTLSTEAKIPSVITIHRLSAGTITEDNKNEMMDLLKKQTYWAKDADKNYIQNAVNNSECFLAKNQQNKIVGFVRFISNQQIAYISDMVVDTTWRRQQLGTALMYHACKLVDEQKHGFTALISAKEGDGQIAAPRLYSKKFGFKDYEQSHRRTIYFRYIRMTPEKTVKMDIVSDKAVGFFNQSERLPLKKDEVQSVAVYRP